jgi:hypothetical protein
MLPDPLTSRAVLVGSARYTTLPDLPAVVNNVSRLTELFRDPELWGLPAAHCRVLLDPAGPSEVLEALFEAAQAATGGLLFYYAGHGLVQPETDNLYLALRDAALDRLFRGLRYDDIRSVVMDSPAAEGKVVLLDCCYSGLAMKGGMSGAQQVGERVRIDGTYLMTASAETVQALAPPGEELTAFTGALTRTMNDGVADGSNVLDLDTVYWQVRNQLAAQRRPIPQQRARNDGHAIALVRNRYGAIRPAVRSAPAVVRPPDGYADVLVMPPARLSGVLADLRQRDDVATVRGILRAVGQSRAEQGVAAVVERLVLDGLREQADAILDAAAGRPPESMLKLLDALAETEQPEAADRLLKIVAAGPPASVAGAARELISRHRQCTPLLAWAVMARIGHSESIVALVGAFVTAGLPQLVTVIVDQVGAALPAEDAVALADALREAGREEAAFALYARGVEIVARRQVPEVVNLMMGLRPAGQEALAELLARAAVKAGGTGEGCVELLEALWAADLPADADVALHELRHMLDTTGIVEVVLALHHAGRGEHAHNLSLAAGSSAALSLADALVRAGLPLQANLLVDAAADGDPATLLALIVGLGSTGNERLARRATVVAAARPPAAAALLRAPDEWIAKTTFAALAEHADPGRLATIAAHTAGTPEIMAAVLRLIPGTADPRAVAGGIAGAGTAASVIVAALRLALPWAPQVMSALAADDRLPPPQAMLAAFLSLGPAASAGTLEPLLRTTGRPLAELVASRPEFDAEFFARATVGPGPVFDLIADRLAAARQAQIIIVLSRHRPEVALGLLDHLRTACPPLTRFRTAAALDSAGHRDSAARLLSDQVWILWPLSVPDLVLADFFRTADLLSTACERHPLSASTLDRVARTVDLNGERALYVMRMHSPAGRLMCVLTNRRLMFFRGAFRRAVSVPYPDLAVATIYTDGPQAVVVARQTWWMTGADLDARKVARLLQAVSAAFTAAAP